ncbi:MAG: hypothetical protein AAF745_16695, partial [Planctomycetota bacterium]
MVPFRIQRLTAPHRSHYHFLKCYLELSVPYPVRTSSSEWVGRRAQTSIEVYSNARQRRRPSSSSRSDPPDRQERQQGNVESRTEAEPPQRRMRSGNYSEGQRILGLILRSRRQGNDALISYERSHRTALGRASSGHG